MSEKVGACDKRTLRIPFQPRHTMEVILLESEAGRSVTN